jgi:hypothetical protein
VFSEGAAYNFGRLNADCWHLYTITPHHNIKGTQDSLEAPDQTSEMLMTDLDPKVMRLFYKDTCIDGKMATLVRTFVIARFSECYIFFICVHHHPQMSTLMCKNGCGLFDVLLALLPDTGSSK